MATTNCSQNLYSISFTDTTKSDIQVAKGELITDRADIVFVGKTKRDYGELFDENMLHLLEHFACPEDSLNEGNPDLSLAFGALLGNPTEGQIWYNTTEQRPYRYDGTAWGPLGTISDIAGNYGVIAHGEQLPRPVCAVTGYVFEYDECSWMVAPFSYPSAIDYMRCSTDDSAVVTMQYRPIGGNVTGGFVNYQIVGIKGNTNAGVTTPLPSVPSDVTPTPTPTGTLPVSPQVTPTNTVTPNPTQGTTPTSTPTNTPTNTATPSNTPAPGVSVTPTDTPMVTPTNTPNPTRTQTPGPSQTSTPNPTSTPAVTPTKTPAVTPTNTPPVTVTPTVTPSNSGSSAGFVKSGSYTCHTIQNKTACIIFNSNGTISGTNCGISGTWVQDGFRPGDTGADYSFTAVKYAAPPPLDGGVPSGPSSGTFATTQSWCLAGPGGAIEELWGIVELTITGPYDSGFWTLTLHPQNTLA
jgi:hypothetical protein